jgi:hypothetical protein
MPIRQALGEFAPGRVSRRFGIAHALDAQWVAPPEGFVGALDLATFCPREDAEPLGRFQYLDGGAVHDVPVFRPHRLHTRQPGREIHERSDARPIWHTQIRSDGPGTEVILPRGTEWQRFFPALSFFTHAAGNPVEVRRFTTGADAVIREARPPCNVHEGRIRYTVSFDGGPTAAALGFSASSDAVAMRLRVPETLRDSVAQHPELLQSVVSALFFDAVRNDPELDGTANVFQRAALAEAFVATALVRAEQLGSNLADAARRVANGTEADLIRRIVGTLRPADRAVEEIHAAEREPDDLVQLLENWRVLAALGRAAAFFGRPLRPEDEPWLNRSLRATVGGALLGAFQRLCPQVDAGDLLVELSPGPGPDGELPENEVWFAESTAGGSGFVEAIQRALAEDPRRFTHLVETEIEPSDFEDVDHYLRLTLQRIVANREGYDAELAGVFHRVREADTFADKQAQFERLLAALSSRGIATTHAVVSAISLRLLRPGSSSEIDRLLLELVERHDELLDRHAVSFDDRVYAVLLALDEPVIAELQRIFRGLPIDSPADRHSLLTGLLWPRGASIRRQSLAFWNPFGTPAVTDRLILDAVVPHHPRVISAEDPDWRAKLDAALLADGRAGLAAPLARADQLRDAVLAMASEPIESDSLLLYARVRAYKRTVGQAMLVFDMPEALQ